MSDDEPMVAIGGPPMVKGPYRVSARLERVLSDHPRVSAPPHSPFAPASG
jgi:hypothetical protein